MNRPVAIFCSEPGRRQQVDSLFAEEFDAASAHFDIILTDHDDLLAGRHDRVKRALRELGPRRVVYRGWMMPVGAYDKFEHAVADAESSLGTIAAKYALTHHLPRWYQLLESRTPRSVWIDQIAPSDSEIYDLLAKLGSGPAVVKDFVKSEKQAWAEACYIPDVADAPATFRVIRRFIELRGELLEGGIVLRTFVPLRTIHGPTLAGPPRSVEWRLLFVASECVACIPHMDTGDAAAGDVPPTSVFMPLAARVNSPFFSMDVAMTADDRWIVMELGDGQVTGFPDGVDAADLFAKLAHAAAQDLG